MRRGADSSELQAKSAIAAGAIRPIRSRFMLIPTEASCDLSTMVGHLNPGQSLWDHQPIRPAGRFLSTATRGKSSHPFGTPIGVTTIARPSQAPQPTCASEGQPRPLGFPFWHRRITKTYLMVHIGSATVTMLCSDCQVQRERCSTRWRFLLSHWWVALVLAGQSASDQKKRRRRQSPQHA